MYVAIANGLYVRSGSGKARISRTHKADCKCVCCKATARRRARLEVK
jgi:hypothetical protein